MVFVLDLHTFFRFHSLVQTIGPATALHGTTGVFVNDDNFTIFNDVVYVAGKQRMSAQRRRYVVHQHDVGRRVQRLPFIHDALFHQQFFNQHQTTFGQVHLARFFVHREVAFTLEGFGVFFFLTDQVRNNFIHAFIHFRAVFCRAGNDQRCTRFIDQDGVHFVHQRIVQFTLYTFFRAERHIVAQVVKAVFVVRTVSDVSCVSFALCRCWHARQVDTDSQAKEFKQRTVVFGVTLRQVVVDGNYVHAFTG